MDEEEVEQLCQGFLAAELSDEDVARLTAALAQNASVADQIGRQLHLHGALADLAAKPLSVDAVMARLPPVGASVERSVMAFVRSSGPRLPPTPPMRRLVWWLAGLTTGAALGVVAALLVVRSAPERAGPDSREAATARATPAGRPQAPPRIEVPPVLAALPPAPSLAPVQVTNVSGRVLGLTGAVTRPLATGDSLGSGEGLVTSGPRSQADLDLGATARVQVGAHAVVPTVASASQPGPHLFVASGSVTASAGLSNDHPHPLVLISPHGVVEVRTAQVKVEVAGDTTRIDVVAGRASLRGAESRTSTEMSAGQYAQLSAAGAITTGGHTGRRVVFVIGSRIPNPADRAIMTYLEQAGLEVTTTVPLAADFDKARASDLIVISSSIAPQELDVRFRDLPVAVLTWEPGLYPILGMAGREADGEIGFLRPNSTAILIKNPAHPLAAGLAGSVDLQSRHYFPWATPGIHAAWVATIPEDPTKAVLFGYERGVVMVGTAAPARRVGFFFAEKSPDVLKPEVARKLFDSAVRWCLGKM